MQGLSIEDLQELRKPFSTNIQNNQDQEQTNKLLRENIQIVSDLIVNVKEEMEQSISEQKNEFEKLKKVVEDRIPENDNKILD